MNLGSPAARARYEASRDAWMRISSSGRVVTWGNVLFNWQISPWWGVPVYFPRLLARELREGKGHVEGEQLECYEHIPGRDYWSVEVRIPLAGEDARLMDPTVGVDGRMPTRTYTWHFNVGRQRVRDGQVQRWAYSPTGSDDFDVTERFAELWGGGDLQ